MNEWQVLMAMEARDERGRFRYRPAGRPSLGRWSSFAMRLWPCRGRVEMVAVLKVLIEEMEELNAKAGELEATIAAHGAGILGA